MKNQGVVIACEVQGDRAFVLVEVSPVSAGCGRCHEAGGCGSHLLNEALRSNRRNVYRLANTIAAQVGDEVGIELPEGAVLRAALAAYFWPLLTTVSGAGLGTTLGETWAVAGAATGLGLGLLLLRLLQQRVLGVRTRPTLYRLANSGTSTGCTCLS